IQWMRAKWTRKDAVSSGAIPQDLLVHQPRAEMRYLLSTVENPLVARLHAHLCEFADTKRASQPAGIVPLAQVVTIHRGEELSKAAALLAVHPPADGQIWYPVLRGGVDVRPYAVPHGKCWIARTAIEKPLERYLAPTLLVVKSAGQLQATLDLQGHVVLQTLYLLAPRREGEQQRILDELYFLLALLNSRLMREYVWVLYTAYKWVQPQIEQHVLARLPIPALETAEKASIIERARLLMHACSHLTSIVELKESRQIYEEQEHAISALYAAALQQQDVMESVRQVDKGVKGVYLDG
ncbi:MAG: hypothetical protein IMW89_21170, partial [Ktedonobacteraceae bacterium]|nr:hypothetical protein [Ktedonobacteraceae bacterium]